MDKPGKDAPNTTATQHARRILDALIEELRAQGYGKMLIELTSQGHEIYMVKKISGEQTFRCG